MQVNPREIVEKPEKRGFYAVFAVTRSTLQQELRGITWCADGEKKPRCQHLTGGSLSLT
jgi:hypothetical protein